MLGAVILQIILILLNAIFAGAEIAVISMKREKLEILEREGDRRAKRLLCLSDNPARMLAVIQVAITLAGFLGSAYAADNFSADFVNFLIRTGIHIPKHVLQNICVFVITLIISYFSIVFGELIPKRIAMQKPEKVALTFSGFLIAVSVLFAPLVWLLTATTEGILSCFPVDGEEKEEE